VETILWMAVMSVLLLTRVVEMARRRVLQSR
jgi:hypothetical protein